MKKIKSRKRRKINRVFLKWVGLFGCIFMLVGSFHFVNAGMNDSVLEKNRKENIYAAVVLDGVEHIYYLNMYKMNGRVAYCIELGVDITSEIYHSRDSFNLASLTNAEVYYIRLVSYYGYQYSGHDDYRYYMAAQELIWEYLDDVEVEWTDEASFDGRRIDIESYKNEINTLVRNDVNKATFLWINGQAVRLGQEFLLEDRVGVLSDYDIISSEHADAMIEGNYLKIKVHDDYVGMGSVTIRRRQYYDYNGSLYYYASSQKLISTGNYTIEEQTLTFSIQGYSLNGLVIDKTTGKNTPTGEASLEGAAYELYDSNDNLLGTYESDSAGRIAVENLNYGEYYFKQIEASLGYLLNEEVISFEFSSDGTVIELEQEVISNDVKIKKVYSSKEGDYYPEEGAVFLVKDSIGNDYGTIETNQDGIGNICLPYGKYLVQQISSKFGYDRVENFEIIVSERKDEVVEFYLINNLIQSKVRVVTKDEVSGKIVTLEGFSYRIKEKGDTNYLKYDGNDIFTTDKNGDFVFPMLFSYGEYVLEQVDVVEGYIINSNPIEFSICDQSNFDLIDDNLIFTVEVFNDRIFGNIQVISNEEIFYAELNNYGYTKDVRAGVEFLLFANEDIIINGDLMLKKGELVYQGMTDENGILDILQVPLGSYCLNSKDGDFSECFVLKDSSKDMKVVKKEIEVTKFLEKGDIIISNIDENGYVIEGSIFEVYDNSGVMIYTGSTNEEGIIKVDDLIYGNYCFLQTDVDSHYQIYSEKKCIVVDSDKKVEIINKAVDKKVVLVPNTFYEEFLSFQFVFTIISLMGIGVFIYKKVI